MAFQDWPIDPELVAPIETFAAKTLRAVAKDLDATGTFPTEIIQSCGSLGVLGMMVDPQFGGSGLSTVTYAATIERLARECASTAVIASVNNSLVAAPIEHFGSEEQKRTYLPSLADGSTLGCFALSEPGAGSDPSALSLTATKVEGGYSLSGSKNWITNGKEAKVALVFATVDKGLKSKGITAFIVPTTSPGFKVSKLEDKLGIKASSTASLFFDQVRVTEAQVLGEIGQGLKIALKTLDGGRIGIAAQALGIAEAALFASRQFALERSQFGGAIAKLQAIQWMIADMATRLQAARLLTRWAAERKDQGLPFSEAAAMAKLTASEAAMWITTKAIQVHGGYGYTKDFPVERHFRDAKITEIYEGTSEIQRLVIAASQFEAAKQLLQAE
jgi:butyryl-CoA dehydrogenase